MRIGVILAAAVLAIATWFAALAIAMAVPGTPFSDVEQVVGRLADEQPGAYAEFLRTADRTEVIASTVFPLASGLVVLAFSLWKLRLRPREVAAVVVLYALFIAFFFSGFRWLQLIAVVLFTLVVAISPAWSARRRPAPAG